MKFTLIITALAAMAVAKPVACPAKTKGHSEAPAVDSGNGSAKPVESKPAENEPAAPTAGAVCPADNGKVLAAGGSCQCEYQINCDVKATPGASSLFWQKDNGKLIDTLAECNKICDDNDKCEATLWVDEAGSAEYHLCWQTSGLGPTTGTGVARISYKESCKGSCDASYSKQ